MSVTYGRFGFTVVQHSGYGYALDTQFIRGLETRMLDSARDRRRVLAAGGLVFESYRDAEDYCDEEMYRDPDYAGLIPKAPGGFADLMIDGLRVYVPRVIPASHRSE